jgi:hypothetical protein
MGFNDVDRKLNYLDGALIEYITCALACRFTAFQLKTTILKWYAFTYQADRDMIDS